MSHHTPEPWRVDIGDDAIYVVDSDQNVAIARVTNYKLQDVAEANARRIVDCVNALADIPTEALEKICMFSMPRELVEQRDKLAADNATLCADCLTLALRLYAEDPDTFAPETREVMKRWSVECNKVLKGEA